MERIPLLDTRHHNGGIIAAAHLPAFLSWTTTIFPLKEPGYFFHQPAADSISSHEAQAHVMNVDVSDTVNHAIQYP